MCVAAFNPCVEGAILGEWKKSGLCTSFLNLFYEEYRTFYI